MVGGSSSSQRQQSVNQGAEVQDEGIAAQTAGGDVFVTQEFSAEVRAAFQDLVGLSERGLEIASGASSGAVEAVQETADIALADVRGISATALSEMADFSRQTLTTVVDGLANALTTVAQTGTNAVQEVAARANFQEQPAAITVKELAPVFVGGAAILFLIATLRK